MDGDKLLRSAENSAEWEVRVLASYVRELFETLAKTRAELVMLKRRLDECEQYEAEQRDYQDG